MARFAMAASINPNDQRTKAFLHNLNASDPSYEQRAKKQSKLAWAIAAAFNSNGAGLFIDIYLRKFLLEYNGRILKGKGAFLPVSMNVVRAFTEPDAETYILNLLEEEIYSIRFESILDFITDPTIKPSIFTILTEAEEFKIYEFNMLGAFTEFHIPGHERYIFCGASFVREHDELSIIGVFGEENLNPATSDPYSISKDMAFEGREDLVESGKIDVSDFPLFNEINFQPVILLMRIDLASGKSQVRYVLIEKKDAFLVHTDDPFVLGEMASKAGPNHESIAASITGTEKYSDLFVLLSQIPNYLQRTREAEDNIKALRNPTEFKTKAHDTYIRKIKKAAPSRLTPNYVTVFSLHDATDNSRFTVPASGLKIETKGFWKNLSQDAVGADKSGNPVQGRTWVEQTTSWMESNGFDAASMDRSVNIEIKGKSAEGYIYVMRSGLHPRDVYKIGYTLNDPYDRAAKLSSTSGQPDVFNVIQQWFVKQPRAIERQVHLMLKEKRINMGREFFKERFEKIRTCIETVISSAQ